MMCMMPRLCDAWFSCTDYPIVDVAGNGGTLGLVTSGCDCITHLLSQLWVIKTVIMDIHANTFFFD